MILHADADAFYAAVAQRDHPALRGRPVVVGGWVVMAASYEARACGVRSGMPTSRARALCPPLVVAGSDFDAYRAASDALFAIFRSVTPVVQPGSMEEAFLDIGDADGSEVGALVRRRVRAEVGLALSVGGASTKVLAKIASREAKPDGLVVLRADEELGFLHGLPVERIWGVGPATARRLHAAGLRTVGDAAALSEAGLVGVLGPAAGRYVHAVAHNREPRPVQQRRGRRSFGAQRALGRDRRTRADAEAAIADLAQRLAGRMGAKGRAGRTIVLRLRFADYARATRSATLPSPTAEPDAIAAQARALLDAAAPLVAARGLTLVGLTVTNLDDDHAAGEQLRLDVA